MVARPYVGQGLQALMQRSRPPLMWLSALARHGRGVRLVARVRLIPCTWAWSFPVGVPPLKVRHSVLFSSGSRLTRMT